MRCRLICAAMAVTLVATSGPLAAQTPTQVMGATYHDPSRAFIDLMIPHHEMALMMAERHAGMTSNEAVKAIAGKMAADQRREVAELKEARKALFGSDSSRTPMMHDMMQMMGMGRMRDTAAAPAMMPGMRSPGGMRAMAPGDHDRMFLAHMIAHHRDGADMAILAEDGQAAPRVKQLARRIREGQEREIAEMQRILHSLPAPPGQAHDH